MSDIDVKYSVAKWYKELKASSNASFFPLFNSSKRYLVLMGGAGSGKSIFAGRKILERVTSEKNHRVLVVRKVAKTLRDSCYAQLAGQIYESYKASDFKISKSDMTITHKNGSSIIFAGLDDVEKLKSIYNITMIWVEEASEILEADFNQLDIRLRGATDYYKQIILTFNPIDINHWLKKRFFDALLPDASVHRSTYRDNRFLDAEAIKVLEAYKDTDPYYYTVYCLGEWGVYGNSIFDKNKIAQRLSELPAPVRAGAFLFTDDGMTIKDINFVEENSGYISIYKEPDKDVPYVIGADTAGDGSDYFAAHVINNITGEQVATLHGQYDEDVFAKQIYCLGTFYNDALIGIEANFSSFPIKELERLGYQNQYVRETEDSFTHRFRNAFGFKTTAITRPIILAELVTVIRDCIDTLNDRGTLEELLTFVRNGKGRPEASAGCHDDYVISLAITHHIRDQQRYTMPHVYKEPVYNFASERPKADPLGIGETIEII